MNDELINERFEEIRHDLAELRRGQQEIVVALLGTTNGTRIGLVQRVNTLETTLEQIRSTQRTIARGAWEIALKAVSYLAVATLGGLLGQLWRK